MTQNQGIQPGPHGWEATVSTNIHDLHHSFLICVTCSFSSTGLEFAYSQAPESLQGLVMGAFLVTSALGSYVASLLVIIVRAASNNDWYPSEDLNQGHMENFYFLLAGLMLINFCVFLYIASSYKYKTVLKRTKQTAEDLDTGQPANCDPPV